MKLCVALVYSWLKAFMHYNIFCIYCCVNINLVHILKVIKQSFISRQGEYEEYANVLHCV